MLSAPPWPSFGAETAEATRILYGGSAKPSSSRAHGSSPTLTVSSAAHPQGHSLRRHGELLRLREANALAILTT